MQKKFAVIGMGHFGSALARELTERGADVLAIDENLERLDDVKDLVTHTVRLDSTEAKALKSQGVGDVDAAVVAFGDDFEATLLTVSTLQNLEVGRIIVRATTEVHERILHHLGIKEVILPAVEAAERLANSLTFERVVNSFQVSTNFTIVELSAPDSFVGKTVLELDLRTRFEVNLITIKRSEEKSTLLGLHTRQVEHILGVPEPSTVIERGDVLVIFGAQKSIKRMVAS